MGGHGPRVGHRLRLRMQRRRLAGDGPLWCSISWPRCGTRYANCVRCAQTTATSQSTKRAARAGHELCAPRHCIGAAAGGPPTAWSTLALPAAKHTRSVAAARLLAALHKAPSVPAEDGGEANPGSKGGAGSRRLTAGERARTRTVQGTVCAWRAPGAMPQAWTDSLPRRPRPALDKKATGRYAPIADTESSVRLTVGDVTIGCTDYRFRGELVNMTSRLCSKMMRCIARNIATGLCIAR